MVDMTRFEGSEVSPLDTETFDEEVFGPWMNHTLKTSYNLQ